MIFFSSSVLLSNLHLPHSQRHKLEGNIHIFLLEVILKLNMKPWGALPGMDALDFRPQVLMPCVIKWLEHLMFPSLKWPS